MILAKHQVLSSRRAKNSSIEFIRGAKRAGRCHAIICRLRGLHGAVEHYGNNVLERERLVPVPKSQ